jgi:2',3'-cyclic-nucleotide 2'-phosphodiesterase/3'-nucleotidase
MRKFLSPALAAIAFISLLSCQTPAPRNAAGSLDRSLVELLPNGKAKTVDIYSFNDFHGTVSEDLTPPPLEGKNPGIAKFAQAIRTIKAINPNSVFVSGGDNYQGSALSVMTKGKIISEAFKEIGVSASAIGNHEFDWGDGNFAQWTTDGGFPFLAANLVEKATGKTPAWAKPYTILTVGGHRIALIGLVTAETLTTVKKENVARYDFLDAAATAKKYVLLIQRLEAPEAIIAISHIPAVADKIDPARAIGQTEPNELEKLCLVRGLDAIVTGHSHTSVNGKANGVPVVQAYYNGRSLAKLSFTFKADNSFSLSTSLVELYKNKASITENAAVKDIYTKYMDQYADVLLEKICEVPAEITHEEGVNVTPMGFWVCEAMRARFGTQVAVMNGGGLRKGFAAGTATVQDFWDLMPFDNTAITFKVSGAVLKKIIDHGIDSPGMGNGQFSGLVVRYDSGRAYENKVISMTLADGSPVKDEGSYTVVTNDFMFLTGGDGYTMMPSTDKGAYTETFIPIRDILIERAKADGKMIAVTPAVLVAAKR